MYLLWFLNTIMSMLTVGHVVKRDLKSIEPCKLHEKKVWVKEHQDWHLFLLRLFHVFEQRRKVLFLFGFAVDMQLFGGGDNLIYSPLVGLNNWRHATCCAYSPYWLSHERQTQPRIVEGSSSSSSDTQHWQVTIIVYPWTSVWLTANQTGFSWEKGTLICNNCSWGRRLICESKTERC